MTSVTSARDLMLILPDRVGSLHSALSVFEPAGVNIIGHAGFPAWAGEGVLHLIVDDATRATEALRAAGLEIREEREVLIVEVENRPGALAAVFAQIAQVGVNVDLTYALADGRVVIGVNDGRRAERALTGDHPA